MTERVGVDLILPVASLLPLERLVQWSERFEIPRRALDKLADNADAYAEVLLGSTLFRNVLGRIPKVGPYLHVVLPTLTDALKGSKSKIKEANEEARRKQDYLTAVLTQFRLDLEQGVRDNLLVTSRK